MKTTFRLNNADDMEATLTATMTLGQWKALRAQLPVAAWPGTDLRAAIYDLIVKADQTFCSGGD